MPLQGHRGSSRSAKSSRNYISCVIAGAASNADSQQVDVDELLSDFPEAAAELLMDLKRVVTAPGKFCSGSSKAF